MEAVAAYGWFLRGGGVPSISRVLGDPTRDHKFGQPTIQLNDAGGLLFGLWDSIPEFLAGRDNKSGSRGEYYTRHDDIYDVVRHTFSQ